MAGALLDLFEFLKQYKIQKCKGPQDVKTGDVVACFDAKTKQCLDLGTVKHVGHQQLSEDHSDGEFGEVFVLSYQKGRSKKGQPLNQQDGWWMYGEIAVLPTQGEHFSQNSIARAVMFVGHKATTRQEQLQQNWSIEVQPIQVKDLTEDDSDTDDQDLEQKEVAQKNEQKKKRKHKRKRTSKPKRKQTKKVSNTPTRRSPRKAGKLLV